jgi:hypothetical protein
MLLIEKHIPWQYPRGEKKKEKGITATPEVALSRNHSIPTARDLSFSPAHLPANRSRKRVASVDPSSTALSYHPRA